MRKLAKHYWGNYKFGALVWIFLGLVVYLFSHLYQFFIWPKYFLPGSSTLAVIFFLFAPYLTSLLLSSSTAKSTIEKLVAQYPKLFFLAYLIPEDIKEREFPEVEIPMTEWMHFYGYVTKKWVSHTDPGIVWCHVVLAHCPIVFTGNLVKIKESRLIYTGRYLKDMALTHLSFGAK